MPVKGLVLLSSGLDSSLAALLAKMAGIEVVGLYFASPFVKAQRREGILELSRRLAIPLIVKSIGLDFLDLLKQPEFGYGKNVNPCIDCKIYMFQRARRLMEELHIDLIITGEVLGQRSMTQKRQTIKLIERRARLEGRIIRPLSAKLFEPTAFELSGAVDREKFESISGRSRKKQFELAKKLGLTNYPSPGGGCYLTNPNYARRMIDLLKNQQKITFKDINLLKIGRHFRLGSTKLVVARNQMENEHLYIRRSFAKAYLFPIDFGGPLALAFGNLTQEDILWTAKAIARYGKRVHNVKVGVIHLGQSAVINVDEPLDDEELKKRML